MVGERARQLMLEGHSKLKPADSTHIATAALANVEELHTFDGKMRDLDGVIDRQDGKKLKICRPGDTAAPVPLLEAAPTAKVPEPEADPDTEAEDYGENDQTRGDWA